MKVALIANPLIPVPPKHYGGIERIVSMLINVYVQKGLDVTLWAGDGSDVPCKLRTISESVPYNMLDAIRINTSILSIAFNKFDIVHTFGRMSNIAALMPLKIPKVVSYQLPPTISQVQKANRLAFARSLSFTACSAFIANQIAAVAPCAVIPNGIPINAFKFVPEVNENAPLVFLGRIQYEKGTHIAIQIALKLGMDLVIAGNIPNESIHQAYFEAEVKPHLNNSQITYVGPVNDVQKSELLGRARAFLMPVLWDEPFGIVMTEALACGAPVIGFNRGAIPEVVQDGINGFICSTTQEMEAAVTRSGSLSRLACRQIAEQHFSDTVLADFYIQHYQHSIQRLYGT